MSSLLILLLKREGKFDATQTERLYTTAISEWSWSASLKEHLSFYILS